ncbi:MAG: hypothetical protein K2W96_23750 [Gemmataceae bacterium]|nr:hypothetical protein [Gemmataceae bacterium]
MSALAVAPAPAAGPHGVLASVSRSVLGAGAGGKTVLTEKDFKFVGTYKADSNLGLGMGGGELNYGQGFTHRYVRGELRFLTLGFISNTYRLVEFAAPAKLGATIKDPTAVWRDIWKNGYGNNGWWHGLWWDEGKGRLWTASAVDYPNAKWEKSTKSLMTRKLKAGGEIEELRGVWGLEKIGQRRIFGGATAIPSWFQKKYGVGPYAVGFGGYTSRMSQGLSSSLGPTLYAIPDPAGYKDGTDIPTGKYRVLMDHGAATGSDWYKQRMPTLFDRGVRNSDVINYYDSGDPRPNPSTAPVKPPAKGAQWLSPAPDGLGRWVWGDCAWNTGNWIDGPNKHGFLIVPTFMSGKVYYSGSTLHAERKTFEIQVFDPEHLGEVSKGKRKPWDVKPSSRKVITEDLKRFTNKKGGGGPWGGVYGATFDPKSKRLYVLACSNVKPFEAVIHVYNVDH